MRIALVGYGAVATIHAEVVHGITKVCGPSLEKAEAFAKAHQIPNATTDLQSALENCDVAIIASPSHCHYSQAAIALDRGIPTLIEFPACATTHEAKALAGKNTLVQCAHTARYLEPYRRLTSWIRKGSLGDVRQIHYFRCIPSRQKSWTDDALLHHAAHALDLLLDWFGSIVPRECLTIPSDTPEDVTIVGTIPNGGIATIIISYAAKIPSSRMTVIGTKHTAITDGFSYIESDLSDLCWQGKEIDSYKRAIFDQDAAFLDCCQTYRGGVPWSDTLRLTVTLDHFRSLSKNVGGRNLRSGIIRD